MGAGQGAGGGSLILLCLYQSLAVVVGWAGLSWVRLGWLVATGGLDWIWLSLLGV